jgi:hypothetical protein
MTTHNPALIRLVASRYRDLQGLSTVADAALLLLSGAGIYLAHAGWREWGWWFLILMSVYVWARMTWIRRWIDAYYASRCGRVRWSLGFPFAFPLYLQGLLLAPILLDLRVPTQVRVAFVLLLLGGLPARIVSRDWPYRAHWLLPCAAGVVVAAMFAAVNTRQQATAWLPLAFFACGGSLAFSGLLDHALLVKTLHAGRSDQPERAPVQVP